MSDVPGRSLVERLASLTPEQRRLLEAELAARGSRRTRMEIPRRATGSGPFPLSFAQQRLWFLELLEPAIYHVTTHQRIHSRLSFRHGEQAFNEVLRRHDALRTTFGEEGGRPFQVIHPAQRRRLSVIDLRRLGQRRRKAEIRRLHRRQASRPFDLGRLPLFRMAVVQLAEDDFSLLLTLHHIVSDDWSIDVFFREFRSRYQALLTGRPSPLPPLLFSFSIMAVFSQTTMTHAPL